MAGEDLFRPTSRKKPVNVIPDAELPMHRHGGACWCEPRLETWRMGATVTYRLMHRRVTADPCGAGAPVYAPAAVPVPAGITDLDPVAPAHRTTVVTCKKPRGHASARHEDRDGEGRLIAEWSV